MKCKICENPVTFPGSRYCGGCLSDVRDMLEYQATVSAQVKMVEPDPPGVDWDIISRITPWWILVFLVGVVLGYAWAWNALGGA